MNKLYIKDGCVQSKAAMMVLNLAKVDYQTIVSEDDSETPVLVMDTETITGYTPESYKKFVQ